MYRILLISALLVIASAESLTQEQEPPPPTTTTPPTPDPATQQHQQLTTTTTGQVGRGDPKEERPPPAATQTSTLTCAVPEGTQQLPVCRISLTYYAPDRQRSQELARKLPPPSRTVTRLPNPTAPSPASPLRDRFAAGLDIRVDPESPEIRLSVAEVTCQNAGSYVCDVVQVRSEELDGGERGGRERGVGGGGDGGPRFGGEEECGKAVWISDDEDGLKEKNESGFVWQRSSIRVDVFPNHTSVEVVKGPGKPDLTVIHCSVVTSLEVSWVWETLHAADNNDDSEGDGGVWVRVSPGARDANISVRRQADGDGPCWLQSSTMTSEGIAAPPARGRDVTSGVTAVRCYVTAENRSFVHLAGYFNTSSGVKVATAADIIKPNFVTNGGLGMVLIGGTILAAIILLVMLVKLQRQGTLHRFRARIRGSSRSRYYSRPLALSGDGDKHVGGGSGGGGKHHKVHHVHLPQVLSAATSPAMGNAPLPSPNKRRQHSPRNTLHPHHHHPHPHPQPHHPLTVLLDRGGSSPSHQQLPSKDRGGNEPTGPALALPGNAFSSRGTTGGQEEGGDADMAGKSGLLAGTADANGERLLPASSSPPPPPPPPGSVPRDNDTLLSLDKAIHEISHEALQATARILSTNTGAVDSSSVEEADGEDTGQGDGAGEETVVSPKRVQLPVHSRTSLMRLKLMENIRASLMKSHQDSTASSLQKRPQPLKRFSRFSPLKHLSPGGLTAGSKSGQSLEHPPSSIPRTQIPLHVRRTGADSPEGSLGKSRSSTSPQRNQPRSSSCQSVLMRARKAPGKASLNGPEESCHQPPGLFGLVPATRSQAATQGKLPEKRQQQQQKSAADDAAPVKQACSRNLQQSQGASEGESEEEHGIRPPDDTEEVTTSPSSGRGRPVIPRLMPESGHLDALFQVRQCSSDTSPARRSERTGNRKKPNNPDVGSTPAATTAGKGAHRDTAHRPSGLVKSPQTLADDKHTADNRSDLSASCRPEGPQPSKNSLVNVSTADRRRHLTDAMSKSAGELRGVLGGRRTRIPELSASGHARFHPFQRSCGQVPSLWPPTRVSSCLPRPHTASSSDGSFSLSLCSASSSLLSGASGMSQTDIDLLAVSEFTDPDQASKSSLLQQESPTTKTMRKLPVRKKSLPVAGHSSENACLAQDDHRPCGASSKERDLLHGKLSGRSAAPPAAGKQVARDGGHSNSNLPHLKTRAGVHRPFSQASAVRTSPHSAIPARRKGSAVQLEVNELSAWSPSSSPFPDREQEMFEMLENLINTEAELARSPTTGSENQPASRGTAEHVPFVSPDSTPTGDCNSGQGGVSPKTVSDEVIKQSAAAEMRVTGGSDGEGRLPVRNVATKTALPVKSTPSSGHSFSQTPCQAGEKAAGVARKGSFIPFASSPQRLSKQTTNAEEQTAAKSPRRREKLSRVLKREANETKESSSITNEGEQRPHTQTALSIPNVFTSETSVKDSDAGAASTKTSSLPTAQTVHTKALAPDRGSLSGAGNIYDEEAAAGIRSTPVLSQLTRPAPRRQRSGSGASQGKKGNHHVSSRADSLDDIPDNSQTREEKEEEEVKEEEVGTRRGHSATRQRFTSLRNAPNRPDPDPDPDPPSSSPPSTAPAPAVLRFLKEENTRMVPEGSADISHHLPLKTV